MRRNEFARSSYCASGECLEAGVFAKSSYSHPDGPNCVEAGIFGAEVRVADTAQRGDPGRPVLAFEPAAWQAFVDSLKAGSLGR